MELNWHNTYQNFLNEQLAVVQRKMSKYDTSASKSFVDFLLKIIPNETVKVSGVKIDEFDFENYQKQLWDNQSKWWIQAESLPNYFIGMSVINTWLKKISNPTSVLSIGCGFGLYEIFLQQSVLMPTKFFCTDISLGMINEAKKFQLLSDEYFGKKSNLDFKVNSAEKLPFGNKSMDAVVCNKVLHWCENEEVVIKEIVRVLKPKGLGLIIFPTGQTGLQVRGLGAVGYRKPLHPLIIAGYFDSCGCKIIESSELVFPKGYGQPGGPINDYAMLVRKK